MLPCDVSDERCDPYDDMHTTDFYFSGNLHSFHHHHESPSLPFSFESLFAMYGSHGQTSGATSVLPLPFFFIHMVISLLNIYNFCNEYFTNGCCCCCCFMLERFGVEPDTRESCVLLMMFHLRLDFRLTHAARFSSQFSSALYFEILVYWFHLDGFHRCLTISESSNYDLKNTTHLSDTPYI